MQQNDSLAVEPAPHCHVEAKGPCKDHDARAGEKKERRRKAWMVDKRSVKKSEDEGDEGRGLEEKLQELWRWSRMSVSEDGVGYVAPSAKTVI